MGSVCAGLQICSRLPVKVVPFDPAAQRNHKLISADGTQDAVEVVSILVDQPRRRILAFTDLVQFATMSVAGLATGARRTVHLQIRCRDALMSIAKMFGWLPNMNQTAARPTNCHSSAVIRPAAPSGLMSSRLAH